MAAIEKASDKAARSRADWQDLDREHHLHPFTDHKDLHRKRSRIIARAEGCYIFDVDGNKILDGMSGLWCVNAGYGREELVEAAARQMRELPYYNNFFQCAHPPAIELAAKLDEDQPAAIETCVLRQAPARNPTTRSCAWCAGTGICWSSPGGASSSAARTRTTDRPWRQRRWAA